MAVTNRVLLGGMYAKEEAKYPFVASCDERWCYFTVSAKSQGQGEEALAKHKCPYSGNERSYFTTIVPPGSNFHEALWELVDSCTDALMLHKAGSDHSLISEEKAIFLKGRANGLASAIMWFAGPYFDDITEVSAWALERYKMRTGQREWEPTVGCEGYDPLRGEPTERWATKVAELRRHAKPETQARDFRGPARAPKAVVPKQTRELDPAEIEAIKGALTIGALDDATIADMFKISVPEVRALKA